MMSYTFIDTDCQTAHTCMCGFCKRWEHIRTADIIVRDCDYGDCRTTATTHCPRFGYPVCDRHAHANCHNHAKGAECTTLRIPA
jgi:hypothetical protein